MTYPESSEEAGCDLLRPQRPPMAPRSRARSAPPPGKSHIAQEVNVAPFHSPTRPQIGASLSSRSKSVDCFESALHRHNGRAPDGNTAQPGAKGRPGHPLDARPALRSRSGATARQVFSSQRMHKARLGEAHDAHATCAELRQPARNKACGRSCHDFVFSHSLALPAASTRETVHYRATRAACGEPFGLPKLRGRRNEQMRCAQIAVDI